MYVRFAKCTLMQDNKITYSIRNYKKFKDILRKNLQVFSNLPKGLILHLLHNEQTKQFK